MERSISTIGRRGIDAGGRPALRAFVWTLTVLALVVLAALWLRGSGVSQQSIQGMPEAERQALYQRTVQNLDGICLPSVRSGFESFCQSQAELVLRFPECDASCASRFSPVLSRPTR